MCNGIADHKHERYVVASDPERANPVVPQVTHKYLVTDKHQRRQRRFAEQSRRTDPALVADIAQREPQALPAPFHRVQSQMAGKKQQIGKSHHPPVTILTEVAKAAPITPQPSGKMNSQSNTTLMSADTILHHIANFGAPSNRITNSETAIHI